MLFNAHVYHRSLCRHTCIHLIHAINFKINFQIKVFCRISVYLYYSLPRFVWITFENYLQMLGKHSWDFWIFFFLYFLMWNINWEKTEPNLIGHDANFTYLYFIAIKLTLKTINDLSHNLYFLSEKCVNSEIKTNYTKRVKSSLVGIWICKITKSQDNHHFFQFISGKCIINTLHFPTGTYIGDCILVQLLTIK